MEAIRLASTLDMPRDEWNQIRRETGIGGSDAAAIAGLNKYKSPMSVWLEKTGQIEPEEPGEAAYWGTILEDVVAQEFAKRTGLKIQRLNAILQHPEYPFMIANLDRLIIDRENGNGILECKTASEYLKSTWADDLIPDAYAIQCHHYLAVTGYQYAFVAVLIGGNKFQYKRIDRDEEIIQHLIKIESDFWQLVQTNTPPPMDGSDASADALKLLYPESQPDTEIVLPYEAEALLEEREAAISHEKMARARRQEAENKLKAMLGTNEAGYIGDRRVVWPTIVSTRVDVKRLKAERPDIYEEYAKESVTRRFDVR